jgi:hypothetical protein
MSDNSTPFLQEIGNNIRNRMKLNTRISTLTGLNLATKTKFWYIKENYYVDESNKKCNTGMECR